MLQFIIYFIKRRRDEHEEKIVAALLVLTMVMQGAMPVLLKMKVREELRQQ